jgi:twitching motility protein PilT
MARLDPLLKALVQHHMEVLVLAPGSRPRLKKGDSEHEVTQGALDQQAIEALLTEVAPAGLLRSAAPQGTAEFSYSFSGREFQFALSRAEAGWNATVSPLSGSQSGAQPPASPSASSDSHASGTPHPALSTDVFPEITQLLDLMLKMEASDLHLSAQQQPRLRIHGDLTVIEGMAVPSSKDLKSRLEEVMPERNRQEFETTNDTDLAYEYDAQARFRVNVFRDRFGVGAVFRQIPTNIPSFEQLGLPDALRSLAHLSKGLVLVTGPTGAGKSTTLAAIIDLINETRRDHIITIEDPIEFVHPSKQCLVNQREVVVHTESFKDALRAALREDPDVVLVGEMRDLETTSIAIETAETGHLVFGTLHTTTAPSTVERVVDQFPGDRQEQIRMMLSESLRAVVSQSLLKKIEGGRVAAFEILICTPAVSNLIREGKTFQISSAMQTGRKIGMVMLTDSLFSLVKQKIVEPEEAYLKAVDKEALAKKLTDAGIKLRLKRDSAAHG